MVSERILILHACNHCFILLPYILPSLAKTFCHSFTSLLKILHVQANTLGKLIFLSEHIYLRHAQDGK